MSRKQKKTGAETTPERAIILTALDDIAFEGWTMTALERAAQKLGHDKAVLARLFPRGLRDAAACFSDMADDALLAEMDRRDLEKMRIRDRVTLGVRARLEFLAPHREAVRQMTTWLTPPPRALLAARLVWRTADRIWWKAGDRATDYNHYTKRILLSGVLASTTLHWLGDGSKGFADSWAFLDRRIDNVLKLGQKLGGKRKKRAA